MGQLCGIALRLAGNGFDTKLVDFTVGKGREHHTKAQLRKEGEPKRIVFVHVQNPRYSYRAPFGLIGRQRLVGEVTFQLIVEEVGRAVLFFGLAKPPLAAVAGNVLTAAGKFVDGQPAVVGAALTFGHAGLKLQICDLLQIQHGGLISIPKMSSGNQRCAESAHNARDIGTDCLTAGDLFKASKNRVVVESASLYHNVLSEGGGVGDFNYFKERVLDNGVGQSRGNIGDGSAFLLRLLYFGVHKYRTAGSQINGMFGKKGGSCKILHTVIQGFGKGFDERTAAGGAGLVKLYAVYGLIFNFDAFHVLSADVQNAVYLGIKEGGRIIVRYGFHFAVVQQKGSLHQGFAVTGGAGAGNFYALGKQVVNFL